MAVRPLLTTGVALASAGAIIAATPGLMTPPDITVAASDVSAVAPTRAVTVKELKLLGISDIDPQTHLQRMLDIFFRTDGWGGVVGGGSDPYYGGDNYGWYELYVNTGTVEEPVYEYALDEDGYALYAQLDENGVPIAGTEPIYIADGDNLVQVNGEDDDPVYASGNPLPGDIYRDGAVGLAYYVSDQILDEAINTGIPLLSDAAAFLYNNVNPYFYEAGIEETIQVVVSELTGGVDGAVSQGLATAQYLSQNWIPLVGALASAVAAGVPLVGTDLANATTIFFSGAGNYDQGIDGVIKYVIDRVIEAASEIGAEDPATDPEDTTDEDGAEGTLADKSTAVLASASKALPTALSRLINLDLNAEDAQAAEDGTTVDKAEGSSEISTLAAEITEPEAAKAELSKLANLKLDLKPTVTVEEPAEAAEEPAASEDPEAGTDVKESAPQEESGQTEEESGQTNDKSGQTDEKSGQAEEKSGETGSGSAGATGAAGGTGNKFTPHSRFTQGKKSAGQTFVEKATDDLRKAFKATPKASANADAKATGSTAAGDSGSGSTGSTGSSGSNAGSGSNASSGGKSDTGSKSDKGHKDRKDRKGGKDK